MLDRKNLIRILKIPTGSCILLIWLKKYLLDGINLIWNSLKMINVRKLRLVSINESLIRLITRYEDVWEKTRILFGISSNYRRI